MVLLHHGRQSGDEVKLLHEGGRIDERREESLAYRTT